MERACNVLGISGSLRRGSFNTSLLKAAQDLCPEGMAITFFTRLAEIPPYNEDLREQGFPEAVEELRDRIREADALLLVTPEYNYSVPGVLKNAIDWASRPPEQPFEGKPIAIMGASPGALGTARAQYHLRQCFVFLNGFVMNRPEIMVGKASEKFNADGELHDPQTRELLVSFLEGLRAHAKKFAAHVSGEAGLHAAHVARVGSDGPQPSVGHS